jgi:threonine/homoserine/homoserine lactone efflux protein
VGAAYLIVIGIRRILSGEEDAEVQVVPTRHRRLYMQGAVVNVLNPKTALFFLAFLPQFVDASQGSVPEQVALLGVLFVVIAFTSDAMYALLADLLAGKLRRSGTGAKVRRWVSGGIFIALGVTAATARRVS